MITAPKAPNLIRWQPFQKEAFEQAKREKKVVLLSISGVWCHWCHVMDHQNYDNQQTAQYINENYIPIRVDTDQNPEVNQRYNMGGWPTTAFLDSEGEILYGGTYFPPETFQQLIKDVVKEYQSGKLTAQTDSLEEQKSLIANQKNSENWEKDLSAAPAYLLREIMGHIDPEFGGLGDQPKFPHGDALLYLNSAAFITTSPVLKTMLELTFHGMSKKGMFDHVEGGFFRYSTDRKWEVPHFEKMSEDYISLIPLSACMVSNFQSPDGKYAYEKTLEYIAENWDCGDYWCATQDADEKYYALDSITERRKQEKPYIDRTLFTDWNLQLTVSIAKSQILLGKTDISSYAEKAKKIIALTDGDTSLKHYRLQSSQAPAGTCNIRDLTALLETATFFWGHQKDQRNYWRKQIDNCISWLVPYLDESVEAFHDIPKNMPKVGRLKSPMISLKDNADLATALLDAYVLTNDQAALSFAKKILRYCSNRYRKLSFFGVSIANASLQYQTLLKLNYAKGNPATLPISFGVSCEEENLPPNTLTLCYQDRCTQPFSHQELPDQLRKILGDFYRNQHD